MPLFDTTYAAAQTAPAEETGELAQNGWGLLDRIYQDLHSEYGVLVAVLLVIIVGMFWLYHRSMQARLKERQAEINRMAKDLVDLRRCNIELTDKVIGTKGAKK